MPTPEQVLNGLQEIVNKWQWLAIAWHVYLGVFVLGLVIGIRPSGRVGGILVGLPLFSVSILALISGNPFNGILIAIAAVAIVTIPSSLGKERVEIANLWELIPGIIMILFGWLYPHFLEIKSFLSYLYSAPTGLVPCPTLSVLVGFGLVFGGFGSRVWLWVVGLVGLFYGIFGAMRLGVTIDWVLLIGALWLIMACLIMKRGSREALKKVKNANVEN